MFSEVLSVQPHGLNLRWSDTDTLWTAREGKVHPSIQTHAERSEDVSHKGGGLFDEGECVFYEYSHLIPDGGRL